MTSFRDWILALVLVSVAALALAFSILEFRAQREQSRTLLNAMTLERELERALKNSSAYTDENIKIALRSGRKPVDLTFRFLVPLGDERREIVIRSDETLTLDRSLRVCTTYPLKGCGFKIRVSFDSRPPTFSYEVASLFPEAPVNFERSGRTALVIPRVFYRSPSEAQCDTRTSLGLTALRSSDDFECLGFPKLVCARGTLPKGLIVNEKTHSLELDCGPATRVARCPAFYALSRVNTKTLDARGEALSAACVRVTSRVARPLKQPDPAPQISGRACPAGYRSDSSCSLVNVVSRPGHCGTVLTKPVEGVFHFRQNVTAGSVDCGVDQPVQSCGAIWHADVKLTVQCVLDQPEFVDAL